MALQERTDLAEGLNVCRIVTGLWQVADQERLLGKSLPLDPSAHALLDYARDGFNSFDMADHYGTAEEIVGAYLSKSGPVRAEKRLDLQVFTKWVPKPGPITKESVQEGVDTSLKRLGVQCIDLLQFHWWDYSNPGYLDAFFFLKEMQDEGKILHIGLTNFDTAHLRIVLQSGIRVVSNQICFSLLDTRAAHEMGDLCTEFGVKILAFGTVAGGLLSERWLGKPEPGPAELVTWSQAKYKRFCDCFGGWHLLQELLGVLKGIGDKHSVPIAVIAARWVLQQRAVAAVIIGARLGEREHRAANRLIFSISLDADDLAAIAKIHERAQPIPGDCGDEYRKPPFLTASGDLSHHVSSFPSVFDLKDLGHCRKVLTSGTKWEDIASFSRAVRRGRRIYVSGTTATHGTLAVAPRDPRAQMTFALDKVEASVRALGGSIDDIVRTRVYVRNLEDWEAVAREHGRFFRASAMRPANTLVQAALVGDEYLVEVEADAEVEMEEQAAKRSKLL